MATLSSMVVVRTPVINLSWSGYRDSDYEDYWTETRPLDTTVYFPTGMKRVRGAYDELLPNKAIQRIASVDLGSLNWTYHASSGGTDTARFIATASQLPFAIKNVAVDVKPNILCTKYNTVTSDQSLDTTFGNLNIAQYLATDLVVVNTAYTSASTFKTAMNGVILYYEVATPIETTITPALNLTYRISDFGTEEWIQPSSSFVPFIDAEIFYQENLRDKIQRLADIQKPSTETDGVFIPEVSVVSGAPTISWQPKAVKELPTLPVEPISTVFVLKCTVDENGADAVLGSRKRIRRNNQ